MRDIDSLKGKRVLMRRLQRPVEDKVVKDDTRIAAALPTFFIQYVLESGASVILMLTLRAPWMARIPSTA